MRTSYMTALLLLLMSVIIGKQFEVKFILELHNVIIFNHFLFLCVYFLVIIITRITTNYCNNNYNYYYGYTILYSLYNNIEISYRYNLLL